MHAGSCTYTRVDGVWYVQSSCGDDLLKCPRVAKVRKVNSSSPGARSAPLDDADKEPDFEATFKVAFGDDFSFKEADVMVLGCPDSGPGPAAVSVYKQGNNVHIFRLGPSSGGPFPTIVRIGGYRAPRHG